MPSRNPSSLPMRCKFRVSSVGKGIFFIEKRGIGRRVEREPALYEIGGQCSREGENSERRGGGCGSPEVSKTRSLRLWVMRVLSNVVDQPLNSNLVGR